ncbi:hypothetical protein ACTFIZ_007637, partial [Dictyostelium cf. discoideum]
NDELDNKQNKRLKTTRVEKETNKVNSKLNGNGSCSDDNGSDGIGSDGIGSDGIGSDGIGSDGVGSDGKRKGETKTKTHYNNLKEEVLNSFKESGNQTFNINNLPISPIQNVFKNCRDMDKEPIPLLNDSFKEKKILQAHASNFQLFSMIVK